MAGRRKRGGHEDHEEHFDESWLVSYADMMTLLVALFMVLFSISSVNISKFESLQRSLQEAFSGRILPGGQGINQNGGSNNIKNPSASEPFSSLQPYIGGKPQEAKSAKEQAAAAKAEDETFKELKKRVDAIARQHGLDGKMQTRVTADGLFIRVMTDDLLFDSGSAVPRPEAVGLMAKVGAVLADERDHPVVVEGHTDTVPVSGAYPTNWELSTARASSIVRAFSSSGIRGARMTAAGRAYLKPIADNATAAGRTLNRRVEILLPRLARPAPDPTPDLASHPG